MFEKIEDESPRYSAASQSEDTDTLLSGSRLRPQPIWERSRWPLATVFVAGFVVATFLGAFIGSSWTHLSARKYLERTQNYSPVMKDVGITYSPVLFNGSLLKENIYRQDAAPEVDAAWEALGVNYRAARIPADQALKSGLVLDQVHINEKYGGGYPANVEGLHHLHCLNLLRKSLYYNYDYYHARKSGAFVNEDHIVRKHVSHCLDILRQQLMCTVDTGMLGQVWLDRAKPRAFVDFNTKHQCRNFEAVRQWAEANQLPASPPADFLVMPGEKDTVYSEIP